MLKSFTGFHSKLETDWAPPKMHLAPDGSKIFTERECMRPGFFSWSGLSWVPGWLLVLIAGWPFHLKAAQDFRQETIYFVIPSRFYDGDATNNFYNRDNLTPGDPHWRGDFKGLIEQLDYIEQLGFTAIWLTPPIENRSGLDYHGYHGYDWYKVDPRLESKGATYKDFIDAAHARGIKVVQDVVINHSSNYGIRDQVFIDRLPHKYYRSPNNNYPAPYRNHIGNYQHPFGEDNDNSAAPDWFKVAQTSDPEGRGPFFDPISGRTLPDPDMGWQRFFATDAQKLDPVWYHLDGFIAGGDWENPWALQNKHIAGDCIDLNSENQVVQDYLNGAIKQYLEWGVDAIRIDTAKHIDRDLLLEKYVNKWKEIKPDLFVFGEVLVKGTGYGSMDSSDNGPSEIRPWWYTRTGKDPYSPYSGGNSGLSVLDFGLFSTFRDNLSRGYFSGIGSVLGMDWIFGDSSSLVTFFQNHDLGPDNDFKYRYGGHYINQAVAYNVLWTIRGIPTLYYGEEIQFKKGKPQDIQSGSHPLEDTGRAYFGGHLQTPKAKKETMSHPLFQHIKRLNQIRRAVPALQKGNMGHVAEWGSGMHFSRYANHQGQDSFVVVGLATAGSGQNIVVDQVPNGVYRDAVSGGEIQVSSGRIEFWVQKHSVGAWVLNGPGRIGEPSVILNP